MTPNEIEQAVISNIRENKDQDIPKLKACLEASTDSKEKAYCADMLGIIYNFIDDDLNSKTESVKYFHMAYKLVPNNQTYVDNACGYTFASITKYSTIAVASKKEADFLSTNFDLMTKCKDYVFPWQKDGVGKLSNIFMIAGSANNLGKFYYQNAQTKEILEKAKKFFKIAYDSETYLKVTHGGNLAAVHYKLGEIQEAATLYEECMEEEITEDFPKTEKANCAGALSLIALETKAFKKALSFSKIAHKLDPGNGYYLHNLASSYFATKQYNKAKHYFEKCTEAELIDQFTEATKDSCYHGIELIGSLNSEL